MCNMKMTFCWDSRDLGLLSRMAPQPHMMSDLCSSHQSVTTQTVQQLYNCDFSISLLTSTKSPHLESDLLTTHDQLRRQALLRRRPSSALAGSWVGARCAWPGLFPWRKGWGATPSTHSIQPSWLHRTPPTVTSRACLCRCAFVSRSHVGRVVSTSLQHDEGVSKRLEHPHLALVRELLVQLQQGTSLNTGGSRGPPSAWTSPCVASLVPGSSYIQSEIQVEVDLTSQTHFLSSGPFADDDGL